MALPTTPPSPVSLWELREHYDALVTHFNNSNNDDLAIQSSAAECCRALEQTCRILLSILLQQQQVVQNENLLRVQKQVEQTAQQCALVQEYLLADNNNNNNEPISESAGNNNSPASAPTVVVTQPTEETKNNKITRWHWRLSSTEEDNEDCESRILTFSKAELVEEEAILMQMAHTPIPSTTKSSAELSRKRRKLGRLRERIQEQWAAVEAPISSSKSKAGN